MDKRTHILFVDAYDSFSQNILALLYQETKAELTTIYIDTDVDRDFGVCLHSFAIRFDAIVIGPGPGNPNNRRDVGVICDLLDIAADLEIPVLGICLGFQVLCIKYGLPVEPMKQPCHGHSKRIMILEQACHREKDSNIFEGTDLNGFYATCYNSLGLIYSKALPSPRTSRPSSCDTDASRSTSKSRSSSLSATKLFVLAIDQEDNVMAIRHSQLPLWGIQFHPESCKSSPSCRQLVRNWWLLAQSHRQATKDTTKYGKTQVTLLAMGPGDKSNMPRSTLDMEAQTDFSTTYTLFAQLLKMSPPPSNRVNWRRIDTKCSREEISTKMYELAAKNNVAMLESTKKGRFSIYSTSGMRFSQDKTDQKYLYDVGWRVQYSNSRFSILTEDGATVFTTRADRSDVWSAIQMFVAHQQARGGCESIPFWGGFVGYISYEHGLASIGVNCGKVKTQAVPDICLIWMDRSVVHDNTDNAIYIQSIRRNDSKFLDILTEHMLDLESSGICRSDSQYDKTATLAAVLDLAQITLPGKADYRSRFDDCQSHLRAGNSYELCLTNEAIVSLPKTTADQPYEFALYQNLHAFNPVPFGAFFKTADMTILSTSPEEFMSWTRQGTISMIPMKGTVRKSPEMTYEKASEILSTPKESAENLMIADLIRHDLYSAIGYQSKVEVVKLCEVVEHETVYQLVSHIRAHAPIFPYENATTTTTITTTDHEQRQQQQAIHYGIKTLHQALPPGSMTGAPKKRSCEILSTLEQRHRGVYSGVLGYMDVGGSGSWSVCIRTAFRYDGDSRHHDDNDDDDDAAKDSDNEEGSRRRRRRDIWRIGAGGAITVLSDVEGEWEEMMVKLDSVLQGFRRVKSDSLKNAAEEGGRQKDCFK